MRAGPRVVAGTAAALAALTAGCGPNRWHTVAKADMRVQVADVRPTHSRSICGAFRAKVAPQARLTDAMGYWDSGDRDPWWQTMLSAPHLSMNDVWLCSYAADSLAALPGMLVQHRDGSDNRASVFLDGSGEWVPALVSQED